MLHLMKMAVGIDAVERLRAWQRLRARRHLPLRHRTRTWPARREELIAGGSIYWVFGGAVRARQRLLDVVEDLWDDGTSCAGLVPDPVLVEVEARPQRAFRGWRYLDAASAPPDLERTGPASGAEAMRQELRALGLL
jgi:hypothetical protein